jgi:subtilase family serine protease
MTERKQVNILPRRLSSILLSAAVFFAAWNVFAQPVANKVLPGHVPGAESRLPAIGRLPGTNQLSLAIGLPLRNRAELENLLADLYNPASPNFHKFLTPEEYTARFGPTEQEYLTAQAFAFSNGFIVTGIHGNRLVLDVEATAADVERAFHITLKKYRHPTEPRDFFAPDTEPSVAADVPVVTVEGLSDYRLPRPLSHKVDPLKVRALAGSGPSGYYAGNDFRNAYVPGTTLTGAGQAVGLLEFSAYYKADITNYQNTIGRTNYVPLTNVVVGKTAPSTANNAEVALDIEVAIAIAPGLSRVIVYEIKAVNPSSILSRMANDNLAKQLSSSWTWSGGPSTTVDNILLQMAAQGQSFFQASGDEDAYTGTQILDNASQINAPVACTNLTAVGGTMLTMNGSGVSWSSETTWNWNNIGQPNIGSGGGISTYYRFPPWQTNVSMASNSGSTTWRNVPDVALTADDVFVVYDNGSTGGFGGTSAAAPLWAGFCALVNQQSVAASGTTVGFLNPALYAIARSSNYTNCFHDITTGNNIGTNTPGLYNAVTGYDLCTGLGTPNGTNLINALAPSLPAILTQPVGQTVTNGANAVLSATAGGSPTLVYAWQFNGTNLSAGGNLSGVASNVLTITAATTNNSGSYRLVVTNNYGSATSSAAVLNVGFAPAISTQPTNLTVHSGSNAIFSATVSGTSPLTFQWQKNGTNLVNGSGISGATSNVLALTAVTTTNNGNYRLLITNLYGAVTSSVAGLTVVLPPAITGAVTNRTVECGSNLVTFFVTASGTPPLVCQWSLDSVPVTGATNTSYSLTNLHQPNHTVAVTVTNPYGSVVSNALVTVLDTLVPTITLNGTNPLHLELGGGFTDPGATASDVCAGTVAVVTAGLVNTNVVGTNMLTYTATDGGGNTNQAGRSVIVRDTTPPMVLWSFTNLVMAADTNCSALLPDVTGTNYILATDVSGALTITQTPTNHASLLLGSNTVILTIQDASANAAHVTNTVVVEDQTPPLISSQPQSRTNPAGSSASFSVSAQACTPLRYQWLFNGAALTGQTNGVLLLTNVHSGMAGDYAAAVTAAGGSMTSSVASLTVNLLASSVGLGSSANSAGYGDNLNFTASVTPTNATGFIQFSTNDTLADTVSIVAGTAVTTNIAVLPRGTNLIAAAYAGDTYHLPSSNTLVQIITNHPPAGATASSTNPVNRALEIPLTELEAKWSDADGDAVVLAGFSPSTNGITLTNNGVALVYFNPANVADRFVCVITDGEGGTNYQTVTVAALPAPRFADAGMTDDGGLILRAAGSPGYTCVLEAATNLIPPVAWQPVATNVIDPTGIWELTGSNVTRVPPWFLRLRLAP